MSAAKTIDWSALRKDFPILDQKVHGQPLIYFDNAATSQKPRGVIDALVHYYEHDNANMHRLAVVPQSLLRELFRVMAKLHHRLKHLAQARQMPRHGVLMGEWVCHELQTQLMAVGLSI